MTRVSRFLKAPVLVSTASVMLLAMSSLVAVSGLFLALLFAQAQAEASDQRAECRSRVVGYISAVEQTRDSAGWTGLLAAVDTGDIPDEVVEAARLASDRLAGDLADLRENVTEVCDDNPGYNPSMGP